MHDLFMGLAFIAMVAAPAMVATMGGRKEMQPDPEPAGAAGRTAQAPSRAKPQGQVIRPHSMHYAALEGRRPVEEFEATTLPLRARGMAGR